ncbi:MAG: MarR family winged helix-turn-helix transcriptional regulator [Fastidiosipilaceae bacterium]|jgi:DNA-binding MarR family transcriptional regulator
MSNRDESTQFPQPYFTDEVIHLVNDINVTFQKLFHEFYAPYGLTFVQIPVLMALRRHGVMTVSQLGKELEIGSSNITPLCKRLENAGLVTRTRSTEDQRVVHVEITPHALDLINKIEHSISEVTSMSERNEEDNEIIIEGLQKLYARLVELNNNAEEINQNNRK